MATFIFYEVFVLLCFTVVVFSFKWLRTCDKDNKKNRMIEVDQCLEFSLYRQHLKKIDNDNSLETRCELARRLLAFESNSDKQHEAKYFETITPNFVFFPSITVFIFLIIFFAGGVYVFVGSPFVASSPFSVLFTRDPLSFNKAEQLVHAEVMVIRNPENGQFADTLADLYLKEERFWEAVQSAHKAILLQGENSHRLLRYALAHIGHDRGLISDETEMILRRLIMIEPQNIDAHVLLVRGLIQGGNEDEAIRQVELFLHTAPVMAKWKKGLEEILQKLKQTFQNNREKS